MREFYEHVVRERAPRRLRARRALDRRLRGRAREGARADQRAVAARGDLHPQRHRRRSTSSRTRGASRTSAPATSSSSPSSSTTRTSCPWQQIAEARRRRAAGDPDRRQRRARARGARRDRARGPGQGRRRRTGSRTRSARSTRSSGSTAWAHEQGAIMVVDAAQAVPHRARRRAGARLRLPRLHVAQALRPDRRRRAVGPARAARGDAAVRDGRRDDPDGHARGDDLERPAVQVRGGHARHRRGRTGMGVAIDYLTEIGLDAIERRTSTSSPRTRSERLSELPYVTVYGPPAERRAGIVSFDVDGVHPARRRAGARLGGRRRPRRPPLHAAADDAARRRGDDARELLPLLAARGGRPAGRGRARRRRSRSDERVRPAVPRGHPRPLQEPARARRARRAPTRTPRARTRSAATRSRSTSRSPRTATRSRRSSSPAAAARSARPRPRCSRRWSRAAARPRSRRCRATSCSRRSASRSRPVRLKCALLGLGTLKVALHKAKGTPLPEEWAGMHERPRSALAAWTSTSAPSRSCRPGR